MPTHLVITTVIAAVAAVGFATGCQDDISTRFPPGLEPLDDDAETLALDDTPAEELRHSSDDTGYVRVYGRGHVFAPLSTVWAAARDPQVLIATCETTSQSVTPDNEPEYALSFLAHYYVDDILDVEWDDQWRGDVIDPMLIMIKHQKIEGSDFITLSEGTIALVATEDANMTELRFVEHLDAVSATAADVLAGMQHTYDALRAVSHGEPIPACR